MRAHETVGRVYRRCGCRDEQRRQLGAHCPHLISDPARGTWTFAVDLPVTERAQPRRAPRRLSWAWWRRHPLRVLPRAPRRRMAPVGSARCLHLVLLLIPGSDAVDQRDHARLLGGTSHGLDGPAVETDGTGGEVRGPCRRRSPGEVLRTVVAISGQPSRVGRYVMSPTSRVPEHTAPRTRHSRMTGFCCPAFCRRSRTSSSRSALVSSSDVPPPRSGTSRSSLQVVRPQGEASLGPLLRNCARRGMRAPAVGDGTLGSWKALAEVFPGTRHQRCRVSQNS